MKYHIISFRKTISRVPKTIPLEEILSIFEKRLLKSNCDKVNINRNDRIIIRNELFRIPKDFNLNIWFGIGKGEIVVQRDPSEELRIVYSLNYTKALIYIIVLFITAVVIIVNVYINNLYQIKNQIFLILIPFLLLIINLALNLSGHQNLFNDSVKEIKKMA